MLPRLAAAILRANLLDLDVEQLLDGAADVVLGGMQMHFKRVLVVARRAVHPFFRHQRAEDHLIGLQPRLLGSCCLFGHVDVPVVGTLPVPSFGNGTRSVTTTYAGLAP